MRSPGCPSSSPFAVAGAATIRNASGLVVLRGVEGAPDELEHYHERFRSPPHPDEPGPRTVRATLRVVPNGAHYLPRAFEVRLPLPDPDSQQANDVFDPVEVTLYPGPTYPVETQWAVIRRTRRAERHRPSTTPRRRARVCRHPGRRIQPQRHRGPRAFRPRGEALVIIPGLRPATFAAPESTLDLEVRRDKRISPLPEPDSLLDADGSEPWLVVEQPQSVVVAPGRRTAVAITMG